MQVDVNEQRLNVVVGGACSTFNVLLEAVVLE